MGSWTIAILRGSSDCRLRMFSKWVSSGGQGMALECAIRVKQQKETQERDAGHYAAWTTALKMILETCS